MQQLVLLFVTFIPFICSAEVPDEIERTAGYWSAQNILMRCTSASDALLFLSEFESECEPIADDGRETYRCRLTVTIEATRVSDTPQLTEVVGDFLVVSKMSNTKEGWSAEIEEVKKPT